MFYLKYATAEANGWNKTRFYFSFISIVRAPQNAGLHHAIQAQRLSEMHRRRSDGQI